MGDGPDLERVATPLTALLESRMDERGWKLRDVVRPPDGTRVGGPARATMSQHLQVGYWLSSMPRRETIKQLATAVHVSPEEIRDAAYRSMKDHVSHEPDDDQMTPYLPRQTGDLTDLDTDELLALRRRADEELERRLRQAVADNPAARGPR